MKVQFVYMRGGEEIASSKILTTDVMPRRGEEVQVTAPNHGGTFSGVITTVVWWAQQAAGDHSGPNSGSELILLVEVRKPWYKRLLGK